jgi:ribosomal protein L22
MISINELESLIRSGQLKEAERQLSKLGKVKRKDAVTFANMARRLEREHLAVKILNPIVRPTNNLQAPATDLEKIEYADSLRQLGAVNEARELLSEVDAEKFPQALLFQAFCFISEWQYEEALTVLQNYIHNPQVTDYQKAVAQINIAASLIQIGKLSEAGTLLEILRDQTRQSKYVLLHGNSLELTAQMLILGNDLDRALQFLDWSAQVLKQADKVSLHAEKWTAIAQSLKAKEVTPALLDVFAKAKEFRRWEIMRDCELYTAHLLKDQNRLRRLYFSTPYESFRSRIRRFAGSGFDIPKGYSLSPSASPDYTLNLVTGELTGRKSAQLPLGQTLHRFFIVLSSDLYKPVPVSTIFSKLFPSEFMNTTTSVNRVYQIVKRCRDWIEEANLSLRIEEANGTYRLVLGPEMALFRPSEALPLIKEEIEMHFLRSHLGSTPFKVIQAGQIFSRSYSVTGTLLTWGVENGLLIRTGQGRRTLYRFPATDKAA